MDVHRLFGFLAAVVFVAGCGGGSHSSHGSTTTTTTGTDSTASADSTATSAAGAGGAGTTRTVDVTMKDIAFDPATVTVAAGETVTFVFRNEGAIRHDAFLGDAAAQAEHEKQMRESGSHEDHGHDGGKAVTVDPGETGSITHTFKAGEDLMIGCHQAGHYAAGMKIAVTVS